MASACAKMLDEVGGYARDRARYVCYIAGVLAAVAFISVQPHYWRRTVRNVFARQLLFTGVQALWFTLLAAVLVGMAVVVESHLWLGRAGLSQTIGPLLVVVVARELGPLIVNFVIIVNSGSAIATELGIMKVTGEVRVLESQGLDPLPYLVMPRVLAMLVATVGLTAVFNVAAFAGGYLFGAFIGAIHSPPGAFVASVFKAVGAVDLFNILFKSSLPAMLTATICSVGGLGVSGSATKVPMATRESLVWSAAALFVVIAAISAITYL